MVSLRGARNATSRTHHHGPGPVPTMAAGNDLPAILAREELLAGPIATDRRGRRLSRHFQQCGAAGVPAISVASCIRRSVVSAVYASHRAGAHRPFVWRVNL